MNNSMPAQNKDSPPVKNLDTTNIRGSKNILS